jgi:hypothetical protein
MVYAIWYMVQGIGYRVKGIWYIMVVGYGVYTCMQLMAA